MNVILSDSNNLASTLSNKYSLFIQQKLELKEFKYRRDLQFKNKAVFFRLFLKAKNVIAKNLQ